MSAPSSGSSPSPLDFVSFSPESLLLVTVAVVSVALLASLVIFLVGGRG